MKTIFHNRIVIAILLLFTFISPAFPADSPPVIRNWSTGETKPKVEDSHDNIFQEHIKNPEALKNTPKKCLATAVADLDNKIIWQPKWHYVGVGTIRLPDAKISSDRTILTIIENSGKPDAPSSSRLILINCYNLEIIRVIELPEQLLTTICYIPGTNQLVAAIDRQSSLKQSFGFMIIDLTGKNIPQKIDTTEKIVSMACSTKHLFTATATGKVKMFDLASPTTAPVKIALAKNITALAFSSSTNRLLMTGDRQLTYLNLSTMAPDIYAATTLFNSFKPNKIIITDTKGSCLLLEENKKMVLVKNRQLRAFSKEPGVAADFLQSKQLLVMAIRHKQLIQLYKLPQSEEFKPCEPRRQKPKTTGDITMLAFLPDPAELTIKTTEVKEKPKAKQTKAKKTKKVRKKVKKKQYKTDTRLIVIDSHGNIYTLIHARRRWHKTLIIESKK